MKIAMSRIWKKRVLYYWAIGGFFCVMLWLVAKPYFGARYTYRIGDISTEDVISPKEVTYINAKETEKRIEEVRKRVPAVFDFNASVNQEVLKNAEAFFDREGGKILRRVLRASDRPNQEQEPRPRAGPSPG